MTGKLGFVAVLHATKLSLKAATQLRELDERDVRARRDEGLITVEPLPSGRTRYVVELTQFDREIAALRCRGPGCAKPTKGASCWCSRACSVRKYPEEERACEHCGKHFTVEGHRAKDGEGRFCGPSCSTKWGWQEEPERFPQSRRRGGVVSCCGMTTRYLSPAHRHVAHCRYCIGDARRVRLNTPAGQAQRSQLEARQRDWRTRVQAAIGRRKTDDDLLDTADVAELLHRTAPAITRYVARGHLPVERWMVEGVQVLLFERQHVKAFERDWVHGENLTPQRKQWFDPETVTRWYDSRHGISSLKEAESIRAQVRNSRLRLRRRAGRPGHKPTHELQQRWIATAAEVLELEHEVRSEAMTISEVLDQVSLVDRQNHADSWAGYPGPDEVDPAGHRRARERIRSRTGEEIRSLLAYYHRLIAPAT